MLEALQPEGVVMYKVAVALLAAFFLCTMPAQAAKSKAKTFPKAFSPRAIQKVYTLPGPIFIPGASDPYTSAVVSNIVLKLTRDYTTQNRLITYWELSYQYYNGAYRWEDIQKLYLDFVNSAGVVLIKSPALDLVTPSSDCHYNGGIMVSYTGEMQFDFTLVPDMHLRAWGASGKGSSSKGEGDHKC